MPIERLTVAQLIERLQQYATDLPVVVHSYEDGYDPVTNLEVLSVSETPDRQRYVGVYEATQDTGETVLLIASRYFKAEIEQSLAFGGSRRFPS